MPLTNLTTRSRVGPTMSKRTALRALARLTDEQREELRNSPTAKQPHESPKAYATRLRLRRFA